MGWKERWTVEELVADAARFRSRTEWARGSNLAYQAARLRGILDRCCAHMSRPERPSRWTREALIEDARRFKTRGEWAQDSAYAYEKARAMGILDECAAHMPARGLAEDDVRADALLYGSRGEWAEGSPKAYWAAKRKGILSECCAHMPPRRERTGARVWTMEKLLKDARRHRTRTAWAVNSPSAYQAAGRMGVREECTAHMVSSRSPRGRWNMKALKADAARFETREAWEAGSPEAYRAAKTRGLLKACMAAITGDRQFSRRTEIIEDARRHETLAEWKRASPDAFRVARSRGLLAECTAHMTRSKPTLSKARIREDARRFSSPAEWAEKSPDIYRIAVERGLVSLCAIHMKSPRRDSNEEGSPITRALVRGLAFGLAGCLLGDSDDWY